MAEGKKGVLIYADWHKKFDALSNEEAGKLIKHLFYYINDLSPIAPDRMTELLFIDIEQTLKRDLKKWEVSAEKRSESGRLGGLKSGESRSKSKQIEANRSNALNNEANEAVRVSVIGSVIVKDINKKDFEIFWKLYPKKVDKAKSEKAFNNLSVDEIKKILDTVSDFAKFKPFESYSHPNPTTYLNGKRWEDELINTTAKTINSITPQKAYNGFPK